MREVSPGDVIFSFVDKSIVAIGVAQSYCWESPKPTEFGTTGTYWSDIGWKVRVRFTPLVHLVRPKDHIELLRPLLPATYAPLQSNGNRIESVYLTTRGHLRKFWVDSSARVWNWPWRRYWTWHLRPTLL